MIPQIDSEKLTQQLAAALAHRGCCGTEHDPANGKLHGCCIVCGVSWPCETAKNFMLSAGEKHAKGALEAFLGDVQAADLTALKTADILKRDGSQITGFIVCHPETGSVGIIDRSAVRWLSKDGHWWLMHESEGWNPKDVYVKKQPEVVPGLRCPFCGESDFDSIGLKNHLAHHCDNFRNVPQV